MYVDKAVEKNLAIEDTKRIVAYFIPVMFVQKGNPKSINTLEDLKKPGIRIGLGDERSCAVGKKTLKILEKNRIEYSELEKNVLYKSGTVNELGLAIQLRNVDVVILWDANARHFADYGDVVRIPPTQNMPSTIPVVLLKSSRLPDEARAFIEFVTSPEGTQVLRNKGYTVTLP
ncbi:substrate-binding domain-containing protein, partial [Planctomycetota bacterium]